MEKHIEGKLDVGGKPKIRKKPIAFNLYTPLQPKNKGLRIQRAYGDYETVTYEDKSLVVTGVLLYRNGDLEIKSEIHRKNLINSKPLAIT